MSCILGARGKAFPLICTAGESSLTFCLPWRKNALVDKGLAEGHAVRQVHLQDGDGGSACRRSSDQHRAPPAEMPRPLVPPWMKQGHDLSGDGIDPGDVGPFV